MVIAAESQGEKQITFGSALLWFSGLGIVLFNTLLKLVEIFE